MWGMISMNHGQICLYGSFLVSELSRQVDEETDARLAGDSVKSDLESLAVAFARCTSTSRRICDGSGFTLPKVSMPTTARGGALFCGGARNRTIIRPLWPYTIESTLTPLGTPAVYPRNVILYFKEGQPKVDELSNRSMAVSECTCL